jgi:hypothetical protein
VRIETTRRDGSLRRTIIWVVVDGDDTFVRSWKGERGHWYRAALETPHAVTLTVRDMRLPIAVELADDDDSVERCSRALALKYAGDPSTDSMIKPYNLATTLRLVPR